MEGIENLYEDIKPHIYGHDNAKSKSYICGFFGVDERTFRNFVEALNDKGEHLIINLQDGKGYFIPAENEMELINQYYRQELSRLKSIKKKLDGVKRFLNNVNQVTIEEWLNE